MKALTYVTGRPCKRGHVAERYVSTGACSECLRENKSRLQKERASQVVSRYFFVWPQDFGTFKLLALTFASARWPTLDLSARVHMPEWRAADKNQRPWQVWVPCHPDDFWTLSKAADELNDVRARESAVEKVKKELELVDMLERKVSERKAAIHQALDYGDLANRQ